MKISILAFALAIHSFAFAATTNNGSLGAALELNAQTIEELQQLNFLSSAQESLNHMVEAAAMTLEEQGSFDYAIEMRNEWNEQFSTYLTDIKVQDVGDYRPLSPWFADWYKKMEMRFGESKLASLHLDDFKTLNFTIPVVFLPKGNKKSKEIWSEEQYVIHFIPFSGIITYWGSLGACVYLAKDKPEIRKYCKDIAGILRTGMENIAAPRLAHFIYAKANSDRLMIAVPLDDYNQYLQTNLIGQ